MNSVAKPLWGAHSISSKFGKEFAEGGTEANLTAMARVEDAIIRNLQAFVAFARNRLGDHHLAEDAVQESLIKALTADRHPETDEETTTWFYRILRRTIIDVYRKRGGTQPRVGAF